MDFPFLRNKQQKSGVCCLYILQQKIVLARVAINPNQPPELTLLINIPHQGAHSLKRVLKRLLKEHDLKNTTCSWVLAPEDYHLFYLEAPPVPQEEMNEALRWQIKKMIPFPAEDAIINTISLSTSQSPKKNLYAAVAQKTKLQHMANFIHISGFDLKMIDIPEMALRNINSLYDDKECYLCLVLFEATSIKFIITNNGKLLLNRSINVAIADLLTEALNDTLNSTAQIKADEIAFEIQQSFTYCQNQNQQPLPKKLLLALIPDTLKNYLANVLQINTHSLDLAQELKCDASFLNNISYAELVAIGGALRQEDDIHGAN